MTVGIVTDSTCDLPAERVRDAGAVVVPLRLHFGDEEFRDRVDLDDRQFLARLRRAQRPPTTSQPPPGDFELVYRQLLRQPQDEVLSIHIASHLSGTIGSAEIAARSVDPARIHVVDSRSVSLGTGLQVLAAAELARSGHHAEEILPVLASMPPRTGIVCLMDTLHYLELGGRIGRVRALLGSALSIKPLIGVGPDGQVLPIGRVRSRAAGIRRLDELLGEHKPLERLGVLFVGEPDEARRLWERARGTYPGMDILLQHASPVLSSHSGPGTVAYCYLEARS
ncbi:MAG: DegV family protein [Candidatus Dormibacteria bacterium]